jgi:hypothetical protein
VQKQSSTTVTFLQIQNGAVRLGSDRDLISPKETNPNGKAAAGFKSLLKAFLRLLLGGVGAASPDGAAGLASPFVIGQHSISEMILAGRQIMFGQPA